MTEDEMSRWHLRINGHEHEQTLGDGEGQGGLACGNLWDCKEELGTTEQLSNNMGTTIFQVESGEEGSLQENSFIILLKRHIIFEYQTQNAVD